MESGKDNWTVPLNSGGYLFGAIVRAARWGGKGHGHGPGGPWNAEGRQRFEERAREWHQREHGGGDTPPAPTTAA